MSDFTASVISCRISDDARDGADVPEVILDSTAFFPEAGGQLSDRGVLSVTQEDGRVIRFDVTDVQIADGVIRHKVILSDADAAFAEADDVTRMAQPGMSVQGDIDFSRRFDFMQQHTAEHIISGIVHREYGYDNVGFRLSEHTCTMDYNGILTADDITRIERAANEAVWRDLEVLVSFPDEKEQKTLVYRSKKEIASDELRIVTIPGIDVCACCAPHVHRTGEIGLIKVIRLQNWKGGVRCSIVCGSRALTLFADEHDMVSALGRSLSTSWENIPDRFAKMREETGALKRELKELRKSTAKPSP